MLVILHKCQLSHSPWSCLFAVLIVQYLQEDQRKMACLSQVTNQSLKNNPVHKYDRSSQITVHSNVKCYMAASYYIKRIFDISNFGFEKVATQLSTY